MFLTRAGRSVFASPLIKLLRPQAPVEKNLAKGPRKNWMDTCPIPPKPRTAVPKARTERPPKPKDTEDRERSRSPVRVTEALLKDESEMEVEEPEEESFQPSVPCRPKTPALDPVSLKEALEYGWQLVDLGGSGDCGYRAISNAIHCNNHTESLTAEEAQQQARWLRSLIVVHVQKHQDRFQEFLTKDVSLPPEAPTPPNTIKEWLDHAASQGLG